VRPLRISRAGIFCTGAVGERWRAIYCGVAKVGGIEVVVSPSPGGGSVDGPATEDLVVSCPGAAVASARVQFLFPQLPVGARGGLRCVRPEVQGACRSRRRGSATQAVTTVPTASLAAATSARSTPVSWIAYLSTLWCVYCSTRPLRARSCPKAADWLALSSYATEESESERMDEPYHYIISVCTYLRFFL
jgi:hypothetical protein